MCIQNHSVGRCAGGARIVRNAEGIQDVTVRPLAFQDEF